MQINKHHKYGLNGVIDSSLIGATTDVIYEEHRTSCSSQKIFFMNSKLAGFFFQNNALHTKILIFQ